MQMIRFTICDIVRGHNLYNSILLVVFMAQWIV